MRPKPPLLRSHAVETLGQSWRCGIAEIVRAAHERIGGQRRPDGIGQIGAGFHDDREVRGPGNGETESVAPDAEVVVAIRAGQNQRRGQIPQRRGSAVKVRFPAARSRQIIDGGSSVAIEYTGIIVRGWSITLEIDGRQVDASVKRIIKYAADAV